jgi:hypothetical protein
MHGIRKAPDLDKPFFGHIFSEEDRKNLRETGNMGRIVELKNRSGEYIPSFISVDKLTNEVVALKADSVFIPDEVKSVRLTEQEKNDLKEGKAVYLEGMLSEKGKEFNAHIQINADRRGIEFIFENDKLFNRQMIGGVQLTDKQMEDLNAGKAIFVEDMKRKDGEVFSSFVKLDESSGKPAYTRYNPDTPEGAREIYVPKEMGGVTLTAEDREQLRAGKPVFIENMVNRKGEEYSAPATHHALIPTGIYSGYLPKDEKTVYEIIVCRTLEAFAPDCQKEVIRVEAAAGSLVFESNRSQIIVPGGGLFKTGRKTAKKTRQRQTVFFRYLQKGKPYPFPAGTS